MQQLCLFLCPWGRFCQQLIIACSKWGIDIEDPPSSMYLLMFSKELITDEDAAKVVDGLAPKMGDRML